MNRLFVLAKKNICKQNICKQKKIYCAQNKMKNS